MVCVPQSTEVPATTAPWNSNAPISTVPLTIRGKPAPRWSVARGSAGRGIDGQGIAAGVDGGAAGQEGDGLGWPAVTGQRAEPWVGDTDEVAVGVVDEVAGAAGPDQIVRARRGDDAGDVVSRCAAAGAAGVQRDDGVVQGGCSSRGNIEPATGATAGDKVVGNCAIDQGESCSRRRKDLLLRPHQRRPPDRNHQQRQDRQKLPVWPGLPRGPPPPDPKESPCRGGNASAEATESSVARPTATAAVAAVSKDAPYASGAPGTIEGGIAAESVI